MQLAREIGTVINFLECSITGIMTVSKRNTLVWAIPALSPSIAHCTSARSRQRHTATQPGRARSAEHWLLYRIETFVSSSAVPAFLGPHVVMDADGGWKKTLRNFGVEAKRAAERTAQAVSRMGMSEKSTDPDPAFKHLAEQYAEQTTALKSIRDAAATAVEALARVVGAGASLAAALQSALPPGSTALSAAEKHVSAQRLIADGALRRAERRIHARVEGPVEEEIAASREIASRLDQRRKVASDYRRYRARLDDFTGNEGSEDAIKADDKLRELNVLAESLTDEMVVAMPKRTALLERCATELAEILRDFHLEAASGLDSAVALDQLPSAAPEAAAQPVDDLFGDTPQPDILNSSSRTSKESVKPMSQADLLKTREQRRAKSAYTPSHQASSIWDENDPSSSADNVASSPINPAAAAAGVKDTRRPSARAPDYYGVASTGTTAGAVPEPLRRRGDASGYPTGGVGQRESSGYPSGGVGQRESVSSYPSAGVGQRESTSRDDYPSAGNGQKTSVYPSRRAPTTRVRNSEQKLPRSASRESGIGSKSSAHVSDDLLGSFGGSTSTATPSEPQTRPPRQRRSTGNSAPTSTSNSLDDLFNFTGTGGASNNNNSSGRGPTASGSEGDLLGSFQSRPPRSSTRPRQKPSPPTSNVSSSGPSPTNAASSAPNLQREALKKKNEAEIKARAAEKLAAVRERENAKAAEQEKKDDSRSGAERKVLQWTGNGARRGNLRALLASLDTVLYPGNTWKAVSMDVLKVPAKVKLNYRKAILQVHPDKIGPKNLPPDQQVLAELIFDELQNGYEVFVAEQEGKPPPSGSVGPKKTAGGTAAGFQNAAGGMYAGMGRGMAGMGNMGGMGGFGYGRGGGMGGFQNTPYQNAGMGRGMGGMGMGGMNSGYAFGRGANAGRGNMAFGTGRAYGMGMNNQQRR